MNIRSKERPEQMASSVERPIESAEELKRMIADIQRSTKLAQAEISHLMKGNEIKRNQNKKLKDSAKIVDAEMKQLIQKNLREFEEKMEAEKTEHPEIEQHSFGISPFALSRLPSFKFQPGFDPTICLVCYAELESNARCKTLPGCRHIFHSQCIKEHLMVSKFCPGCGEEVHL